MLQSITCCFVLEKTPCCLQTALVSCKESNALSAGVQIHDRRVQYYLVRCIKCKKAVMLIRKPFSRAVTSCTLTCWSLFERGFVGYLVSRSYCAVFKHCTRWAKNSCFLWLICTVFELTRVLYCSTWELNPVVLAVSACWQNVIRMCVLPSRFAGSLY